MARKKAKKSVEFSLIDIIILGVLLVGAVLTIVGVCIDYQTSLTTGLLTGENLAEGVYKLNAEQWAEFEIQGYGAMATFAYLTLGFACASLVGFVVRKFIDNKIIKLCALGVSLATVVLAVVAMILAFTFAGEGIKLNFGGWNVGSITKFTPAVGAWLLSIGGAIGGLAGAIGAIKK